MMGTLETNWISMKRYCCALAIAMLLTSCQQSSQEAPVAQAPKPAPKPIIWPDDPLLPVPGVVLTSEQQAALDLYRPLELGVASEILAGTTHKVNGTKNTIEFKRIVRDTRCPDASECAGNGQLEVEVLATTEGKSDTLTLSNSPVVWNDLTLVLRDVLPHPTAQPQASLPKLQLIIDKASVKYTKSTIPGVSQIEPPTPEEIKAILEKAKAHAPTPAPATTPTPASTPSTPPQQ